MSKLIENELLETLPSLYETEDLKDPICQVKLFTPDADWTWYIIEISKEDKDYCYGYVDGMNAELGYFSISEVEALRGTLGLLVEIDKFFTPTPLSKVKELLK